MFEELSNNLNVLIAKARTNASELARDTGLPASTIKKIRNGDNPNPTLTTLMLLARFFKITLSQLVGEEALLELSLGKVASGNAKTMPHVPLLSWKEAILWPNTHQSSHSQVITEYKYSEIAYALLVDEDDWGTFVKGTMLIIDPTSPIMHRDFVIVYKEEQKIPTLKQVLYDEEHTYLNPVIHGYSMVMFTPQHKLLGAVMEYRKQIKNYYKKP